ncbi:hypothetical protein Vafri_20296 [Volvox africanus]|uniref:Protein kinase domain-containing protein n=1 Tax=Volvox africanus TaxID=51714 RepID=A0A8J4BR20_9CHLO|nr:hypothetical protein Vafri_20296 [Volvox africanus]
MTSSIPGNPQASGHSCYLRVALTVLVLLSHGWSIWGGDAAEVGLRPGHHGHVGEPHGRSLASLEVANVSTADEFVAAFVDPAVELIRLTSSVVDVPRSAWDPYRPVILTRNLSIEGNTTDLIDWPTLQMNRVVAVITLANGIVLHFRNMLLDGVIATNPTPDQGFIIMAPTPPGPPGLINVGPAAFILPACFPARLQKAMVESTPRPSLLPGNQTAIPSLPQDGCVNRTDAPPMRRCYPSRGMLVDLASDGISGDPATYGQKTNFVVWMHGVLGMCQEMASEACLETRSAFLCYLEMVNKARPGTSALAPQTSEDQRQQQQLSTPGTGAGDHQSAATEPGSVVEGATEGSAATGPHGGSSGDGRRNVIIVACAVSAGVAVLAVLLGLAVWARRRRRRRQCGEGTGGISDVSADGIIINGLSDVRQQAIAGQRGIEGMLSINGGPGTHHGRCDNDGTAAELVGVAVSAVKHPLPCITLAMSDDKDSKTCRAASPTVVVTPYTDRRASLELHLRVVERTALHAGDKGYTGEEGGSVYVDADSGAGGNGGGNSDGHGSGEDSGGGNGPESGRQGTDVHYYSATGGSDDKDDGEGTDIDGKVGSSMPTVLELLPVIRGRGAFGRVVEGLYRGQRVAVKLLLSEGEGGATPEEVFTKSFAQEVQILGRCRHPNVVRLLAACVDGPRRCLVMELMETSLERLIHCGPPIMPLPKVLHIGICIANALAYLHPTITHRDLKPANVLINNPSSDQPIVKLSDFGTSRLRLTVAPTADPEAGTPAYMAPECFDLSNNRILHHADMYSLGVLLWEMLTGIRPWQGQGLMDIAIRVTWNRDRLPLEALPSSRCPQKLSRLLYSCWDADPVRRPAAAEAAKILTIMLQQMERENGRAYTTGGVGVHDGTTEQAQPCAAGEG